MAKDSKLTVSLILNDAGFSKQLSAVNRELKLNESEFKKATSTSANFGTTLQGVETKFKNVSAQLEAQGKKVALYKSEIDKSSKSLKELTDKHDEQGKKLKTLNGQYTTVSSTMGENSKEAKELKSEINDLEKSQTNLGNKILSTNTRLDGLKTSLNNAESEFNQLENEVKEADKAFQNFDVDTMTRNMNAASTALKNTGDKISSVGKKMQTAGKNMTMFMTLPIVGVGTAAIKTSMSFEKSMSNVKAVSGVTGEEFSMLSAKAREMGEKTSKSATDAANALGYMGLAGWDTREMMAGLEPILRLSEAGTMDLGLASDLVTDSMGALKLEVEDMPVYLDQVAQTSVKTNTSIQQLMEALLNAGGSAKTLKMPLEETNALLGVLGNNGTKGYEAGTKLNSMLVRMAAQSKPAVEAWDNLGVSVFDGEGKFRGMNTVLMETKDKFKNLTEEEQMYFMKRAVGTDNINTFTQLMDASGQELESLTATIKDSNGELMKVAKTMQDNTAGSFEQFKSKAEEAALKLGETLLPMVNKLLDSLMKLLDKFNSLSPQMQENIVKFGIFAAAIGPVTSGLGGMVRGIGGVVKLSGGFISAFTGSAAAATATGASTAAAATGATAIGAALGSAALAAAPWVAAGAAVVGTGYAIYKNATTEVVPAVDLFATKIEHTGEVVGTSYNGMNAASNNNAIQISEDTKTAIQSYLDLDNGATDSLQNLYVNSTAITGEISTQMTTKFAEMGTYVKTGWKQSMDESQKSLSTFFANSQTMTKEEQDELLRKNNEFFTSKIAETTAMEAEVNRILSVASAEKRQLTQDEANTITGIQDKMREGTITSYSKTEEEASLILSRLSSYDTRISAETASKHIAEAERMRLGSVDAATKEHIERVRQIEFMRDESKVISEDQANKLIAEADRQKTDAIAHADDMKKKVVQKVTEMNGDVVKDVDTQTGAIMTKWDKVKNWWSNLSFGKKKMEVDMVENKYTNDMSGGKNVESRIDSRQLLSPQADFVDSLEVPNQSSYAADTVKSISGSSNLSKSSNKDMMSDIYAHIETIVTSILEKSQTGVINLNIDNFNNNREIDIKVLMEEMEFYRRQKQFKGAVI